MVNSFHELLSFTFYMISIGYLSIGVSTVHNMLASPICFNSGGNIIRPKVPVVKCRRYLSIKIYLCMFLEMRPQDNLHTYLTN